MWKSNFFISFAKWYKKPEPAFKVENRFRGNYGFLIKDALGIAHGCPHSLVPSLWKQDH